MTPNLRRFGAASTPGTSSDALSWFQTGTAPVRYELALECDPLDDARTVDPVGRVEQVPGGAFRWETCTAPHHRGTARSLDEAKSRIVFYRDSAP